LEIYRKRPRDELTIVIEALFANSREGKGKGRDKDDKRETRDPPYPELRPCGL
jgi:hypothetical protein